MGSTLTVLPGRAASQIDAALERLRADQALPRLWRKDASLWSRDPSTQEAIRRRLGWLAIPGVTAKRLGELVGAADRIRRDGLTHAALLGMGGSSLFAEVCRAMFGVAPGALELQVLDTTDPTAIRACQRRAPLSRTLAIVSSKSGTTSEVSALSKYFVEALRAATKTPGAHCVAITDAETPLEEQAKTWKFRHVFTHGPKTGSDVGGRFSALTCFGIFPAALLGVDVGRLLAEASSMFERCGPGVPPADNAAATLGAVLGGCAQAGRDKLTLLCAPPLASFGTWVEQLIAECTGKSGKGIVPIVGEPLRDLAAYAADRLFVELQPAAALDGAIDRLARALAEAGHPVVRIHWQDRLDLGGEVARWSMAVSLAGALLAINPFDEPNVKESKERTTRLLDQVASQGRLPEEPPRWSDGTLEFHGAPQAPAPGSLVEGLTAWLRQARETDYISILTFLPRSPALDAAAGALRERVASRLGRTTMLGFGPRYLHSTGQLFKGGPDGGLFLELTAEERQDLPVPGEPFTFGVLKQAQALGDFHAMQERGRRILRVHLRGDVDRAMPEVSRALEEAMGALASSGRAR